MLDYWTCIRLLSLAEGAADRSPYEPGSPPWTMERDHFLLWGAEIVSDAVRTASDPPVDPRPVVSSSSMQR